MNPKKSVEEQVAELSAEQQDKIVKVGRTSIILQLVVAVPGLLFLLIGIFVLLDPPRALTADEFHKLYMGLITLGILIIVYALAILLFVKFKYPYYSDAKCRYIKRMRKQSKQ